MQTKTVKLLEAVTFNGGILEAGESLELSVKSADALVEEGKAEHEGAGSPGSDETGDPHLPPSNGSENGTGEGTGIADAEEIEKLRKALDDKYVSRIPELKEHAKEVDVQFAHDANKGEIIAAVIEAGKGEAVLAK